MAATARTNQPTGGERIVSDSKVHGGKPTVRDTGVPVERILAQLTANPDIDAVLVRHPNLTSEDIKAVMEYARAAVEAVTDRSTVQDIWANYDPEKVLPAFEALREALRGVDLDELYADIREARGHPREKLPR